MSWMDDLLIYSLLSLLLLNHNGTDATKKTKAEMERKPGQTR